MKYKILGHTGLKVSTLCLGTMNYGGILEQHPKISNRLPDTQILTLGVRTLMPKVIRSLH